VRWTSRHGSRAIALLAFAAAAACPLRASAFCRTVTERPPANYDPQTGCFMGSADAKLLYWKNTCVGYSVQSGASSKVTLDQATKIASEAFAAWSAAACDAAAVPSIDAVDQGPVVCDVVEYNKNGPNQNVIMFHDDAWPYNDPNNTLGLTTVTFDTRSGEIYDADMEINSTVPITVEGVGPAGGYDLKSIVTHEAGHFLGLAHTADAGAVMFARYHEGSIVPTPDDVGGICTIYAADGTRSTTAGAVAPGACDPSARHGFSTECGSTHPNPPPSDNPQGSGGGCSLSGSRGRGDFGLGFFVVLALAAARSLRPTKAGSRDIASMRGR
jgi:hypothetical protein